MHRIAAKPTEKRSEFPMLMRLKREIIRDEVGMVACGKKDSSSWQPTTRSTSSGVL
jgi:hypothetical protein